MGTKMTEAASKLGIDPNLLGCWKIEFGGDIFEIKCGKFSYSSRRT